MKRLPPFAKQLKMKILKGWRPPNGVNIYTSWTMGRPYPHCLTFPPEADPHDYEWSFLTGQEISLVNTEYYAEYEKLKTLAVLLVKSGVKRVGLDDGIRHPLRWYFPRSKAA